MSDDAGNPQMEEQARPPEDHDAAVDRLLEQMSEALRQRQGRQAVRLFLEGNARGLIPAHDGLLQWVVERAGEQLTRRLIAAFAHFPCVACDGGLETCPACEGSGIRAEGVVCEACIGGGRVRCDFCAGSGLATYNLFPPPLRRPILTHRVHMAQRELEKLAALPLPRDPGGLMTAVLSGNKLWCVLENAVIAAKALMAERPAAAPALEELIASCRSAAGQIEQLVRSALAQLADALQSASGESAAATRAEYYRQLGAAPRFERTLLHHPLLDEPASPNAPDAPR